MKSEFDPARLDIKTFAQAGASLASVDPLQNYERLAEEAQGPNAPTATDGAPRVVNWTAEGEQRKVAGQADQVWLHLEAHAVLPMVCQRCLGTVEVPLFAQNDFRFVASEAVAAEEDDESEEDLLVLARDFDLIALVEDELLMALPVVPRHDVCPTPVKLSVADPDFEAEKDAKSSPFASLARLKTGKSG
jgi:uncharacterized protein